MTALETQTEALAPAYGLQITRTDDGCEAVVRLAGELELATAARARAEIERALATSCGRIVLDLRALGFMDSMGMHTLVQAHESCRSSDRSLILLLEPGQLQRTLALSGLLDVLEYYIPEATAA